MRTALLLALLLWTAPGLAQETRPGEIYEPPRSAAGEAYRAAAKRRGIAVDARTLSADASLDLRPPRRVDLSTSEGTLRVIAWVVLFGLVAFLVIALAGQRLGQHFRREEGAVRPRTTRVELADLGEADISATRLSDILAMDDPREALRLLLAMGLARAADANDIALRRSLTSRDVFARVPRTWRSRETLGEIVRRAELVLFGGRPFDRADLVPLVERARPMLGNRP